MLIPSISFSNMSKNAEIFLAWTLRFEQTIAVWGFRNENIEWNPFPLKKAETTSYHFSSFSRRVR